MLRNAPALQGMQVQSLGWEDPLEEKMATHSSVLAWRIPWAEEPRGVAELDTTEVTWHARMYSCLTMLS